MSFRYYPVLFRETEDKGKWVFYCKRRYRTPLKLIWDDAELSFDDIEIIKHEFRKQLMKIKDPCSGKLNRGVSTLARPGTYTTIIEVRYPEQKENNNDRQD